MAEINQVSVDSKFQRFKDRLARYSWYAAWRRLRWKMRWKHTKRQLNLKLRQNGMKAYQALMDLCNAHGWTLCPTYGTLLGIVREDSLIGHDFDLDLMLIDDGSWELAQLIDVLLSAGFEVLRSFLYDGWIPEIAIVYQKVQIDLYFSRESDERSVSYWFEKPKGWSDPDPDIFVPVRTICSSYLPLRSDPKWGVVPVNARQLVEELYGEDWQIPLKKFSYPGPPVNVRLYDEKSRQLSSGAFFKQLEKGVEGRP